jgi:hypothetical protein
MAGSKDNVVIEVVLTATWTLNKKQDRIASCAVISINGVRFFSLPPQDEKDAGRINTALAPWIVKPTMKLSLELL